MKNSLKYLIGFTLSLMAFNSHASSSIESMTNYCRQNFNPSDYNQIKEDIKDQSESLEQGEYLEKAKSLNQMGNAYNILRGAAKLVGRQSDSAFADTKTAKTVRLIAKSQEGIYNLGFFVSLGSLDALILLKDPNNEMANNDLPKTTKNINKYRTLVSQTLKEVKAANQKDIKAATLVFENMMNVHICVAKQIMAQD